MLYLEKKYKKKLTDVQLAFQFMSWGPYKEIINEKSFHIK